VASRDPKTLKVLGLQCRFCIAFGQNKVGSKRKPTTIVQGWSTPFRYDNIENHMRTQHPTQWAQYAAIKFDNEHNHFFTYVPIAFKNSIKAHFPSSSLGIEHQIVFDIDRNIINTIVGNMLIDPIDESNKDDDADVEDHVFGNEAQLNVIMCLRLEVVATTKSRALTLFKRIQFEVDNNVNHEAQFSYSVTIPKTKTTLFSLVVLYVSCGVSQPHFEKNVRMKLTPEMGTWESVRTPKTLELDLGVKTLRLKEFLISLESYQGVDVENGLA
jgi:hypothetical protein